MLSAVELKKGFFMPFEGSFKPLMWVLSGTGSLPSTPVVFQDIRLDDQDFFGAGKDCCTE